jgi:hypothetical protein
MLSRSSRWLGFGLVATAGTGLLALTAMMNAAFAYGDDVTLVIGGTGLQIPNPPTSFVTDGTNNFVSPNFPGFTSADAQGLYTPEQLFPLTGVNSLTLDQSVTHGANIIENAILQQIAEGNNVVVLTDSQSSTIAGVVMSDLAALPVSEQPSADQLGFVLIVDPSNPDGGLFARYPDVTFPSLGVTLSGATPPDTIYPTDIYDVEYDGASDYPQYPIDILADLNAIVGFLTVHGPADMDTPEQIASAIKLPTEGATATTYYMLPETPPLVSLLGDIPVVGQPLEALLGPDLTVLINLGYGNPDYGYSTGPANVPTPAGFLPDVNLSTVLSELVNGGKEGWVNAISAITSELSGSSSDTVSSNSSEGSSLLTALLNLTNLTGVSPPSVPVPTITSGDPVENIISVLQALSTNTVSDLNAILGSFGSAFAPLSDVLLAAVTSLPSFDFNYVLSGISALGSGNFTGFVNDIGTIPGGDITFALFGGLLLADAVLNPVLTTVSDLQSLIQGNVDIISALAP